MNTIPSTSHLTLVGIGTHFNISGSAQVDLIDNLVGLASWKDGQAVTLRFAEQTTLKHNAARVGTFVPVLLACGSDVVMPPNSVFMLFYSEQTACWCEQVCTAAGMS